MNNQLRMTHQREIILNELKRCESHPTADELYVRIKKKLPRISLATVYRNLEILSGAGMIGKIEITGRQKRFDPEVRPHHHVYCIHCHRVDNIDLALVDLEAIIPKQSGGYDIDGCRLEFFGVCPACRQKLDPDTDNTED
jgi:Fe2+ or Zn2+ uptake regulation protein